MAYRTDSFKMLAIGKNAEELREQQPAMWASLSDKIAFVKPFSPDGFSRGAALMAFRLLVAKAVQTLRPGLVGLLLAALVDDIDYELQLPEFEQADEADRREFVNGIRDHRPRAAQPTHQRETRDRASLRVDRSVGRSVTLDLRIFCLRDLRAQLLVYVPQQHYAGKKKSRRREHAGTRAVRHLTHDCIEERA